MQQHRRQPAALQHRCDIGLTHRRRRIDLIEQPTQQAHIGIPAPQRDLQRMSDALQPVPLLATRAELHRCQRPPQRPQETARAGHRLPPDGHQHPVRLALEPLMDVQHPAIPVAAWVTQRLQELRDGGFPDALQAIGLLTRHGLTDTSAGTSFVLAQIRNRQFGAWIPHARQWLSSIQTLDLTALEEELVQEADTCRAQLLHIDRWTEEEQQKQIPDICLQRDRLESFVHALRLTRASMRPTGDALTSALDTLDREGDTREVAIGEVLIELPEAAIPEPLRQAGPVWWCR